MSASAPDNSSPLTSPPMSMKSVDVGTLKLGVESAWTQDDTFVTGIDQSESIHAEAPSSGPIDQTMSDLGAAETAVGALDAPVTSSTLLNDVHSPGLPNTISWAEFPDDNKIGDVPEFPTHGNSVRHDDSRSLTPRIPSELKGKSAEIVNRQVDNKKCATPDWLNHWTKVDELKKQIHEEEALKQVLEAH
ncbi:hypothetical protein BDR05DRAFT_948285 [Suillus weaverae]|nr:hypothetical protein BDR05DRAFT_948285 [Suillus weaverae]